MLTYQRWKAAKVESGECRQTIRARRSNRIKAGDALHHYQDARTKLMRKIAVTECTETFAVCFHRVGAVVSLMIADADPAVEWRAATPAEAADIARRDGFADAGQMIRWFAENYELGIFQPFDVIRW